MEEEEKLLIDAGFKVSFELIAQGWLDNCKLASLLQAL